MIGTLLTSNSSTIGPTKNRKASITSLSSFGTVNDEWTEAGFLGIIKMN